MQEIIIPQLNLSSTIDYSKLKSSLELTLKNHKTANDTYEALGRQGIEGLIVQESPQAHSALRKLRTDIDTIGVAVLRGTEIEHSGYELSQLSSIAIASVFGFPTRTDQKSKQVAWPIHYDPDTKVVRTFSQSLGEATFHTDTQYFKNPEKYFGLFCIEADVEGKGTNEILDGAQAIKSFEQEFGSKALANLQKDYPFKVPSIFTKNAHDEDVELTWAPIYDPVTGMVRYRKDTITSALQVGGAELESAQYDALTKFDKLLAGLEPLRYHLMPGDAILVNNHRMLHARTAFDDPKRFLYRVRMNDQE